MPVIDVKALLTTRIASATRMHTVPRTNILPRQCLKPTSPCLTSVLQLKTYEPCADTLILLARVGTRVITAAGLFVLAQGTERRRFCVFDRHSGPD